jgi:beta-lactamase regulating signal transducer with metallopeptidase domain
MIDWLVGTFVATSALIALVLLVREPTRRLFGSAVTYALWLIPAARMFLPSLTRTVERIVPASKEAVLPVSVPMAARIPPDAAGMDLLAAVGGWPMLLIMLWVAGAVAMLIRGLLVYRAQRCAILSEGVQLAEIDRIRLVRSECVRGPLAFGIIDRVVAVPIDFEQRFSERQRSLALDHELAHHRAGDLVANAVAFVLLCLQWFNPLAWAAHSAFRFDQEAACDARVLDKADARDRVSYGEAIAKAACGKALLFAGALDRPSTLSRRLTVMSNSTNSGARKFGFLFIGAGLLATIPLTATRAVKYVDTVAPAAPTPHAAPLPAAPPPPVVRVASVAPVAAVAPAAAVPAAAPISSPDGSVRLPGGVTLGKGSVAFLANDQVIINGKVQRLEDLTPAERAKLRASIAKSQTDLQRERAELPSRLAEAKQQLDRIKNGDFRREIAENREDMLRDLAEIDKEAAELRAHGQNPEKLKAEIQRSLRETQAVDVEKEIREALVDLNPDKITAELREAEEQMARINNRLNQLDGQK